MAQVGGDHYEKMPIQPWAIIDAFNLGFYRGSVIKYVLRAGRKPGVDPLEDLRKARDYLDAEIERTEKAQADALDWRVIHPDEAERVAKAVRIPPLAKTLQTPTPSSLAEFGKAVSRGWANVGRHCLETATLDNGSSVVCSYRPRHGRVPAVDLGPAIAGGFEHGNPEHGTYWNVGGHPITGAVTSEQKNAEAEQLARTAVARTETTGVTGVQIVGPEIDVRCRESNPVLGRCEVAATGVTYGVLTHPETPHRNERGTWPNGTVSRTLGTGYRCQTVHPILGRCQALVDKLTDGVPKHPGSAHCTELGSWTDESTHPEDARYHSRDD